MATQKCYLTKRLWPAPFQSAFRIEQVTSSRRFTTRCDMLFSHDVICRAARFCHDADVKDRAVLVKFIDNLSEASTDVRTLLERLLLAFDCSVVYSVIEEVKAIIWAVVRTVYARNSNLLSLNPRRHAVHLKYACALMPTVAQPERLFEYARRLYRHYCVYELVADSLTWDELINLLCDLNQMVNKKYVIEQ
ncbi:asb054 [Agrotis segetum nucleopolyhedrovirus B]|uniref:Asb054 n=1 Tax=Agrotis segetum nucleopolyhedrovirus B TaxID=1580580 RepID=A0A0A7KRD9_9ABAC|nr:asb054 [Agrotis segetum nucleopolyhedrovirus B]AIZ48612.1 asb054 [Agrotis segetum nucleopolyhedrovirus B]